MFFSSHSQTTLGVAEASRRGYNRDVFQYGKINLHSIYEEILHHKQAYLSPCPEVGFPLPGEQAQEVIGLLLGVEADQPHALRGAEPLAARPVKVTPAHPPGHQVAPTGELVVPLGLRGGGSRLCWAWLGWRAGLLDHQSALPGVLKAGLPERKAGLSERKAGLPARCHRLGRPVLASEEDELCRGRGEEEGEEQCHGECQAWRRGMSYIHAGKWADRFLRTNQLNVNLLLVIG